MHLAAYYNIVYKNDGQVNHTICNIRGLVSTIILVLINIKHD